MTQADDVVVTGLGAVTPLGTGVEAYRQAVREGRSGIVPITEFQSDDMPVRIGGMVRTLDPRGVLTADELPHAPRVVQLALVAVKEAMGPDPEAVVGGKPRRAGVLLGVCSGGIEVSVAEHGVLWTGHPEAMSDVAVPQLMDNGAASWAAKKWNLRGPSYCVATACATGTDCLGLASEMIRSGRADVMLAGGADAAVTRFVMSAFANARALSRNNDNPSGASRPFDKDRDGFVIGEGAVVFVLERRSRAEARRARIYARLCGYGATNDAHHITAPRPDGSGLGEAMRIALAQGSLQPTDVSYVSAHATSTEQGDAAEATALRYAFGKHLDNMRVGATKSFAGHMLGGAGAVSSLAAVLAVHDGLLTPVLNFKTPDPECLVPVIAGPGVQGQAHHAIANAAGFGGHNSSIVFGAP